MEADNKIKYGDIIYLFVKKIKKQIFYILSQITNELDPFLKYDSKTTNMQILKT